MGGTNRGQTLSWKLGYSGLCGYCGIQPADTVDHIVPRSNGGDNKRTNKMPACRGCNSSKGTKALQSWRESKEMVNPFLFALDQVLARLEAHEFRGLITPQQRSEFQVVLTNAVATIQKCAPKKTFHFDEVKG